MRRIIERHAGRANALAKERGPGAVGCSRCESDARIPKSPALVRSALAVVARATAHSQTRARDVAVDSRLCAAARDRNRQNLRQAYIGRVAAGFFANTVFANVAECSRS